MREKASKRIHGCTGPGALTEQQAVALSAGLSPLSSVSNTFIFSTRQQRAVSVASPTFSYTPFDWNTHKEQTPPHWLRFYNMSRIRTIYGLLYVLPHCSPATSHCTAHRWKPTPPGLHTDCTSPRSLPYIWKHGWMEGYR